MKSFKEILNEKEMFKGKPVFFKDGNIRVVKKSINSTEFIIYTDHIPLVKTFLDLEKAKKFIKKNKEKIIKLGKSY